MIYWRKIMNKIASIVIDNVAKEVDRCFEYIIPEHMNKLLCVGMRVIVPFGFGNKFIEGYVIEIKDEAEYDRKKLKSIADLLDNTIYFDQEMLELAYFLKDRYVCTFGEAFRLIMPTGINAREGIYIKLQDDIDNFDRNIVKKHNKLIEVLQDNKGFTRYHSNMKIARAAIFEAEVDGIIEIKRQMEQSINKKYREIYLLSNYDRAMDFINNGSKKIKKQLEVVTGIIQNKDELPIGDLCKKYSCTSSVIKALEEKDILKRKAIELYRNPSNKEYKYDKVSLNIEQKNAIDDIYTYHKNGKMVTLIHGVTGCGKTEIYLNLVERAIKEGEGAIIMVPEIALTPQTLERFKGRFGDVVAIIHSKLSEGERYDEWRRIKSGEVKVVVGARSAVFSPVKNLKLIIMDEEHEYSYKSDVSPKYSTREVSEFRLSKSRGMLILGSATPSIESFYKTQTGEYALIEIPNRINNKQLPSVKIIDMCQELRNGNKSMFSIELLRDIESNLENNEQTILFLNRRGHSTFISCRACGYVSKCKNCDVALTYHSNSNKLVCHYCGFEYDIPTVCPTCGSKYIKYFGAGTEKIETEVRLKFPKARILRMDLDTTRKKGAHERIYNEFKEQNADILIGTQMISKGMDFKNVTLVGVVAADTTLNLPDFRATERTFQLITQVSGRAGRGDTEGRVVIQTYDPENYSIILASNQNYNEFYKREIEIRKLLKNPPFSDILYMTFVSEMEEQLINFCMEIGRKLQGILEDDKISILGPSPCSISKIKNSYRWNIILKGDAYPYYRVMDEMLFKMVANTKISYSIDYNPSSIL